MHSAHDATFHNKVQLHNMTAAPNMALRVFNLLEYILFGGVGKFVTNKGE